VGSCVRLGWGRFYTPARYPKTPVAAFTAEDAENAEEVNFSASFASSAVRRFDF
jgi:hypothetical protein